MCIAMWPPALASTNNIVPFKTLLSVFEDCEKTEETVLVEKKLPAGGHVFRRSKTTFKLCRAIRRTHVLTKKTATHRDIIRINVLTNVQKDTAINVTYRMLTSIFFNLT
ncbi:hypothetical protein DPMN_011764 [Dreissena polymorpha]|uniref:Uncharacterized protein n=1 Tax=Dreissena polymorpha TaxID=45954 RepID=A0A9D4S258_DREPO|nr:hypothetical protein DPMN_011764 [Dreissena polymorpha]